MPRMKAVVVAVALFTLAAASVRAQTPSQGDTTPSIDDIRKGYRIHSGPFYIDPKLLLQELGVDSNVFNESENPKSDFTFTLTPSGRVALPMAHRALLFTTIGADVVYYQKYSTERSVNPSVAMRGEVYADRLTFFGQGSYLNTRDRPTYEIDIRPRHQDNGVLGGAEYHVTPKFSLQGELFASTVRFADDAFLYGQSLRQNLNHDSTGFDVTAHQRVSPLTTLSVRYQALHDRFAYAPERDSDSFTFMPGVDFKPHALIAGHAFIGYQRFRPKSGLIPGYTGLVSDLALSYTLRGATVFGVSFDRSVRYSFNQTTPYYIDTSPALHVRREVIGNTDVIGTIERHVYDYRMLGQTSGAIAAPAQTTKVYDVNFGYRLKRDLRLGMSVSKTTRINTAPLPPYDTVRVRATLSYGVLQ